MAGSLIGLGNWSTLRKL